MSRSQTHVDESNRATAGGIRYRLQPGFPTISASDDGTQAQEQYLLRTADADAFYAESFPPPVISGGIGFLPSRRRMPGSSFLVTRSINFRPHVSEKVWDPLKVYPDSEGSDSFDKECIAEISYSSGVENDDNRADPTDPITFLERSMAGGGQWLSLPPQKVVLQPVDVNGQVAVNETTIESDENGDPVIKVNGVPVKPQDVIDNLGGSAEVPNIAKGDDGNGNPAADAADGEPIGDETPSSLKGGADKLSENRDYELPVLLPISTIEFNLRWNLVLNPPFGRMRWYMGRVNNAPHPLFFNAARETVLFMGWTASQKFVWNGAAAVAQPWTIDLKFSQRVINDGGQTFGWNHVFSPEKGRWVKLFRANGQPLHHSFSIAKFFSG